MVPTSDFLDAIYDLQALIRDAAGPGSDVWMIEDKSRLIVVDARSKVIADVRLGSRSFDLITAHQALLTLVRSQASRE